MAQYPGYPGAPAAPAAYHHPAPAPVGQDGTVVDTPEVAQASKKTSELSFKSKH